MDYNPNIIYISVHPGAGGDDAKDFARMLLRMYKRYGAKRGWKGGSIDSDTIILGGKNAYEKLKDEAGVHRLVRISPFDSKDNRHTSFVLVEVLPEIHKVKESEIDISKSDLDFQFSKSSGPGGQNVNKVETAVKVVHKPTGVSASSQAERSQARNKERALKLLKSKLAHLMREEREEELDNLRVDTTPDWGHEIRSYVLHPYKQVRDKKRDLKINQVEDVLDGNLDLILKHPVKNNS